MADNVAITAGVGTTIASDDVGGIQFQRVKITTGVDGTATDVSASSPLPARIATTATATLANVNASHTSSTALFASNANAIGRTVHNDSTAILYLKFGTTASATSFTAKVAPDAYYEFPTPVYTGAVEGLWVATNGAARCTELT
jgi:hypothetical protein